MRWVRKRIRLSNSTDASSPIDDFFRLDARVGWLSRNGLSRELIQNADLVSSRTGHGSTDGSECVRIGLRIRQLAPDCEGNRVKLT